MDYLFSTPPVECEFRQRLLSFVGPFRHPISGWFYSKNGSSQGREQDTGEIGNKSELIERNIPAIIFSQLKYATSIANLFLLLVGFTFPDPL